MARHFKYNIQKLPTKEIYILNREKTVEHTKEDCLLSKYVVNSFKLNYQLETLLKYYPNVLLAFSWLHFLWAITRFERSLAPPSAGIKWSSWHNLLFKKSFSIFPPHKPHKSSLFFT